MTVRKWNQTLGAWIRFETLARRMHTLPKNISFILDQPLNDKELKRHPGITRLGCLSVPVDLEDSLRKTLHKYQLTNIFQEAEAFESYLLDRRCPPEKSDIYELKKKLTDELKQQRISREVSSEELEEIVEKKLKAKIHPGLQIKYTQRECFLYLVARFAPEYASLVKIFSEIKKRDKTFNPEHLFDLGSGLGSVMWAAKSVWPSHIREFLNVDSAVAMNELAELIVRDGSMDRPLRLPQITFKLNSPKSFNSEFELVTSAYGLFEYPSRLERFEALLTLWAKLKPGGYLVLAEVGTTHGFRLIEEAREFFLNFSPAESETCEQFAPQIYLPVQANCPHQFECPAKAEGHKCKFGVTYFPMELENKNKNANSRKFSFSYLVVKKSAEPMSPRWPRLVLQEPGKHGNSYHAKLCCPDGKLHHLVASKNRCKTTFKLVRHSSLGDSLPVHIQLNPKKET